MKPGGEVLKTPFEMHHTMEEILSLVTLIKSYDEEVKVIMESTGYYHLPIVTVLIEKEIFVSTVNALRMQKFCSQNIRRAKTDRIDSINIAMFGICYWDELNQVMPPEDTYQELKLLARQYYQTTSMLVKAKINFGTLCNQVMPGTQNIIYEHKGTEKIHSIVKRYLHFDNILKMSKNRFTTDYCKWAQMLVLAKTLPEYQVVRSMSCIGDVLAPKLIAEIGDIRKFHNKHSLIAYAGIDPPPYQSGSFNATERHITKRGNRYLRKTGFEVMQSLIQHKPADEPVYAFIEKKRSEGKCGKEAMIAGLNKFLRIYYGKVTELYNSIDEQLN